MNDDVKVQNKSQSFSDPGESNSEGYEDPFTKQEKPKESPEKRESVHMINQIQEKLFSQQPQVEELTPDKEEEETPQEEQKEDLVDDQV